MPRPGMGNLLQRPQGILFDSCITGLQESGEESERALPSHESQLPEEEDLFVEIGRLLPSVEE